MSATRHRWGVLTDLHLAAPDASRTRWHNTVARDRSRELVRTALGRMAQGEVERVVLLGDLADEATRADYDHLLAELDASGLPAWVIPGNHDRPCDGRTEYDDALAGIQIRAAGAQQDNEVVITGGLRANPAEEEDYTLELDVPPGRDDVLLVVLTHFPLLDLSRILEVAGLKNAGDLSNRAEVARSLAAWPGPVLVLHGHQHVRTHAISDNVLQLGFGALAEQPHDTCVLDLTLADQEQVGGIGVDVRRQCYALHTPPSAWRRSLLDPDETRFTWTPSGWQPIPEVRGD